MKFLAAIAATACALVSSVQAQATAAPTTLPTPLPACLPLNFSASAKGISDLNAVVDTAVQQNLIKKLLVNLDPISVVESRLNVISFSILGTDFAITPIIKNLSVKGVAGLVPRHVKVTNATTLEIGVDFNGSLSLDGLFSFEFSQPNRQWWQLCWINLLDPAKCRPTAIDVAVGTELVNPSAGFNLSVGVQMCPKTAPKGTCSDVTVSTISIAAITGNFATLLTRILRKISFASLVTLSLAVEKVNRLKFSLPAAGPLLQALGERILGFTTTELNKKGSLYRDAINILNMLGKTLVSRLLGESLAPQFGKTCYNVGIVG